jgi:hypothetical protein
VNRDSRPERGNPDDLGSSLESSGHIRGSNESGFAGREMTESELTIEKWLIVLDTVFRPEKPARADEFKDIYCKALCDIEPSALEIALQRCLRELKFYPSVSEIRERAPSQNKQLLSEQAWNEVWRQVEKFGAYRKHFPEAPAFDAATEYALRQVGGYLYLCTVGVNERGESPLAFIRRDFLQAFERFVNEGGAQLFLSQAQAAAELQTLLAAREQKLLTGSPAQGEKRDLINVHEGSSTLPIPGRRMTEEDWRRRISELRQQIKTTEGA